MPKTTRREFTVEGPGPFPIDMLRYDSCWPKNESPDSKAIEDSFPVRRVRGVVTRATLLSDKPSAPEVGRWASFGFKVVD